MFTNGVGRGTRGRSATSSVTKVVLLASEVSVYWDMAGYDGGVVVAGRERSEAKAGAKVERRRRADRTSAAVSFGLVSSPSRVLVDVEEVFRSQKESQLSV